MFPDEDIGRVREQRDRLQAELALYKKLREAAGKMKSMLPEEPTATEAYMVRSGLLDALAALPKEEA